MNKSIDDGYDFSWDLDPEEKEFPVEDDPGDSGIPISSK